MVNINSPLKDFRLRLLFLRSHNSWSGFTPMVVAYFVSRYLKSILNLVLISLSSINYTTPCSLFVNIAKLFMLPFPLLVLSPTSRNFQNILLGQWKCSVFPHRILPNQQMKIINFLIKIVLKISLKTKDNIYP